MSEISSPRRLIAAGAAAVTGICGRLAVTAVISLFAVVAISVATRALFDVTGGSLNLMVPGAIELSGYILLIAVFAAFPVSLDASLVRVEILTERLPAALQSLLTRLWILVLLAFAATLAVLFGAETATSFERGDITQDLRVPLYLIYGLVTLECLALAVACLNGVIAPGIGTGAEAAGDRDL